MTDAAITFFEKHANGGERFRLTLQRVGEEEFKKEIQAAYEENSIIKNNIAENNITVKVIREEI